MAEILIVEDELSINELIRKNLSLTGHHCTQAFDGLSAAGLLENERFDLVILDIMLPGLDGYQVFERTFGTPTIFLTAKSELTDKLKGLAMGADDYLTKPFQMLELAARVEAVLRRTKAELAKKKAEECELINSPVDRVEYNCQGYAGNDPTIAVDVICKNGEIINMNFSRYDQIFLGLITDTSLQITESAFDSAVGEVEYVEAEKVGEIQ